MQNINTSVYHDAGFSTAELRSLEALLLTQDLHWIVLNPDTGVYELILDNQMLSTFRACPAYFMELFVQGYHLKGTAGRSWFLDFGILFHKMIERYYQEFRIPGFQFTKWGVDLAIEEWNNAEMNFHAEHKEYKAIGGVQGFCGLLISYATRYAAENERLRVIGTEIAFGHSKEVLLGSIRNKNCDFEFADEHSCIDAFLKIYLSGRLDLLVDDGTSIAPMDHKTMGSFRFDPTSRFELDEGPCGYVFSVNQILPQLSPGVKLNRSCNKIIMNYISKSIPKEGERFKRIAVQKTTEQLESYRLRMLATSEDLFRALVRYASTGVVFRDTSKCTNWYMKDCIYLPIHRQNSKSNELLTIQSFYEKKPIWNTETVGQED